MGFLSRDQILDAADITTEDVNVPEWGGTVRVRGLTGEERDSFEEAMIEGRGRKREIRLRNIRARLVAITVVDEKGSRLFKDADVKVLGAKSASALDRVFSVAQRLSGLSDEDVEELAADLSGIPGESSSSP